MEQLTDGAVRPQPMRTCVGCRQKSAKRDLVRVIARDGAVVPDQRGRLPGRGAHLHPTTECLESAVRRRAFPRALRVDGGLDTTALAALVAAVARTAPALS